MNLQEIVTKRTGKAISQCSNKELYFSLLEMTKGMAEEKVSNEGKRKLYYISAEFLIGKLLSNNLINLGIYEDVKKLLADNGKSLAEIEEVEPEPSLGNGGLGRLAACFLDSIATLGLNGDGVGLNYHYGLFKQVFKDHKQTAEKNPWITPESWLNKSNIKFDVLFGGFKVTSTLYDIDVTGYNQGSNKLRLFDVDTVNEALVKDGIQPKLAILRVGAKPNDLSYEKGALKKCETIGIQTEVTELPEGTTQDEYIAALEKLNNDASVNGILTFRPLPEGIDEEVIKNVIAAEKDVDCFSPLNTAKLMEGDKSGFPPCTPTAVVEILKHYDVELNGANVAVLGRSMVVGKPAAMLLLNENATVTICHSRTKNLEKVTSQADILVAAVGRAKMIKENSVKEGAVVIDVGINVDENGNLCGDVDTASVQDKVSMITPVPAGVGSVTTSILAKHVVKACKNQNNK